MATVKDPVCGMMVDPARAAGSFEHKGKTYYFCAQHCLEKFRAAPEKYLTAGLVGIGVAPAAPAASPTRKAAQYTCPMHPEIVRDGPGSCPICGMALEPRTAALEEAENPELTDMRRRFWV